MIASTLRLGSLFPDQGVVLIWGEAEHWADFSVLTEAELKAIAGSVQKRRLEYAATRCMARRAVGQLGLGMRQLLNHPDRSPIWPEGVVGSLTHTQGFCAVAVARRIHYRGLGLDAERGLPSPQIVPNILTPKELEWLAPFEPTARARWDKLLFSAKESVFKAQFPALGQMLRFGDVELSPAGPGCLRAIAQPAHSKSPGGSATHLDVRYAEEGDLVVTATTLR